MKTTYQIQSFTDLKTWQKSHLLVIDIYKITKDFPKEELYALTSQMRTCAISITSNIAEGFTRSGKKDTLHFYNIAKSSLSELQNHLLIARDVGYLRIDAFENLTERTIEINKMFNGLTRAINKNS
jgi:four helix bundle protein